MSVTASGGRQADPVSDTHLHGRLLLVSVAEQQRAEAPGQLVLLKLACSIGFAVVLTED